MKSELSEKNIEKRDPNREAASDTERSSSQKERRAFETRRDNDPEKTAAADKDFKNPPAAPHAGPERLPIAPCDALGDGCIAVSLKTDGEPDAAFEDDAAERAVSGSGTTTLTSDELGGSNDADGEFGETSEKTDGSDIAADGFDFAGNASDAAVESSDNAVGGSGTRLEVSDTRAGNSCDSTSDTDGLETETQNTERFEDKNETVSDDRTAPLHASIAGISPKRKKPESGKKKWAKRILFIAVFAFTFYAMYLMSTALNGGEIASLAETFRTADYRFFAMALGLAVVLLLFDAFKYSILSRITIGKYRYGVCLTAGIVGKFYDNITPFAAGGQPFQMVHFAKSDYSSGVAAAIPTLKYVIQLYVYIVVSIVLYLANPDAIDYLDPTSKGIIQSACYVGLVFAAAAPSAVVFFLAAPNAANKVVCFFLKILVKLKIVKNFEETHKKVFLFVIGYQTAFKHLSKKYGGIVFLVLFCVVDCLLYFALPYFLLVGLGGASPSFRLMLDVITLNSYSFFAASLVPTPGNSGAIEASYSMVFAPVAVASGTLFWIVFLWRFLTYYCYIFLGLIYNLTALIRNKIKAEKSNRNR